MREVIFKSTEFNQLVEGRAGFMLYNQNDSYVGKGLETYGEYSGLEFMLLSQLCKPGDCVIEVAANVDAIQPGKPLWQLGKYFPKCRFRQHALLAPRRANQVGRNIPNQRFFETPDAATSGVSIDLGCKKTEVVAFPCLRNFCSDVG